MVLRWRWWVILCLILVGACRPAKMGFKDPTAAPSAKIDTDTKETLEPDASEVPDDAAGYSRYEEPKDDPLMLAGTDDGTPPSLVGAVSEDDVELADERPAPPGAKGLTLPTGAEKPSFFSNIEAQIPKTEPIKGTFQPAARSSEPLKLKPKASGVASRAAYYPRRVTQRAPSGEVNIKDLYLDWYSESNSDTYDVVVDEVSTWRRQEVFARYGLSSTWVYVTGLQPGKTYQWYVRGENEWAWGPWSGPMTFVPKYRPELLVPSGYLSELEVTLSWKPLSNVVSWEIEVDNITRNFYREVYVFAHSSTNYKTRALSPGNQYNWRVRGRYADGTTTLFSQSKAFFPGMAMPIALTNVNVGRPTLSWKPAQSALFYEVRIDNLSAKKSNVFVADNIEGTSIEVSTPLPRNQNYRWWVRPKFAGNVVGAWSPASNFKITALSVPTGLSPNSSKTTILNLSPELSWSAVDGAPTYEVRIDNATTRVKNVVTQSGISTTSWTVPVELGAGQQFNWWVRGIDESGAPGAWSKAAVIKVQSIGVPVLTQPTGTITSRLAAFKWNPSFLAAWYELRVDNLSTREKGVIQVNRITNISYFADNVVLRPNSTYAVYLRSWTKDGLAGLWSKAYQFKVGAQGSAMIQPPVDMVTMTAGSTQQFEVPFVGASTGVTLSTRVDTWVSALDERMRFCTDGNYRFNSGKLQEKWIRSAGCTGPWHYILPNGDVMERIGSKGATGRLVTRVAADVHATPDLLDTASPQSVLVEAASLDDRLRLCQDPSKRDNSGRRRERWVRENDCNGPWYFIIPEGFMYQWNNAPGVASGTLAAGLHPSIWSKPARLHTSSPAPVLPSVTVSGTTLTITAPADARGDYGVVVTGVRGADNDSVIIPVRIN